MTSSPPVICQLLHGLEVGGAEVLAFRLARELRRHFRFVFVCLDHVGSLGEKLAAEGFPVHCLGRGQGLDLRCAKGLRRLIREEKIDLIHAHQYTPFFYASLARQFLGRSVPVLFTEHGRHFPDVTSRKRRLANRWLLKPGDRVVGVGQAVREALVRNEGFRPELVEVIYNGIPLQGFERAARDTESRLELRRELGLPAESLVLIQVARLDYLKDHATALRMMSHLAQELPQSRLLLVGEGPERKKIEDQIARLGLTRHVRMLGQRSDISRLVAASDLLLLTSISEGIPLTLIEGMASGLPVVATDVGGVAEVVAEGMTGRLANAGDDPALARLVVELALDPANQRRMGQLGQARARALFSESRMHSGYVEFYESMLGRVTAGSRVQERVEPAASVRTVMKFAQSPAGQQQATLSREG